MKIADRFKD